MKYPTSLTLLPLYTFYSLLGVSIKLSRRTIQATVLVAFYSLLGVSERVWRKATIEKELLESSFYSLLGVSK